MAENSICERRKGCFCAPNPFVMLVIFTMTLTVLVGDRPYLSADGNANSFIELKISLDQGKYYSLHALLKECNSKLKTTYDLSVVPDRKCEISTQERKVLSIAAFTGLICFQHSETGITIGFPDPENDENRKQIRKAMGKWFNLPKYQYKLNIPSPFDTNNRTVLLIHGLESREAGMNDIADAFNDQKVQVLTFEYPNDGPLAESGKQLSQALKNLRNKHPGIKIAIVAHSMGGLVARYCLECPGKNPECVTDLVTLGTPHEGSDLAGGQQWLELVLETAPNLCKGDFRSVIKDGLGEAGTDLLPRSQFLIQLNNWKHPPKVKYHTAAGDKGFVTKKEYTILAKSISRAMKKQQVSDLLRANITGFVKRSADELQTGSGDGAVSLQSALMKSATHQKVFKRNHLELLSLQKKNRSEDELFVWIIQVLECQQKKGLIK